MPSSFLLKAKLRQALLVTHIRTLGTFIDPNRKFNYITNLSVISHDYPTSKL
jgi:hypothetical protein